MRVAVFGLGYVGAVSAACLATRGHHVVGVDLDPRKVETINQGHSPVIEDQLDELIAASVSRRLLQATTDCTFAVRQAEISLVCVGTPSQENGHLSLAHVRRVTRDIGQALWGEGPYHVVVFRSTMLPGTVERYLLPELEAASKRTAGRGFGIAVNPEFLREGTSVADFSQPARTVIGALDQRSGQTLARLYDGIPGALVQTDIKTAEMIKYADNAFHALKIAFANEIGNICKQEHVDSHELMDIFCLDRKLNLGPAYLRSGAAFGGSCLPKDLRALVHFARIHDLQVPLLESILRSNEAQKRRGLEMILRTKKRKVGILGLSFKPGTDDLRESPAVELTESLIGKGCQVAIYDRHVSLARLVGANRDYIEREIPHISSLMRESLDDVVAHAEALVITRRDPEFAAVLKHLRPDQVVIDLARLGPGTNGRSRYQGICW